MRSLIITVTLVLLAAGCCCSATVTTIYRSTTLIRSARLGPGTTAIVAPDGTVTVKTNQP